jgi:hypothetical protein
MNESVRHLLRESADTVERPQLDVGHLVAQAERRMFRRRLATVAASAVAVATVVVGGVALGPDDQRSAPPPVNPVETPKTPEPTTPALGSPTYFAARPGDSGEPIGVPWSEPGQSDIYLRREGEPARRIISSRAHEHCPTVSPDGTTMAYLRGRYSVDLLPPADLTVVTLDAGGQPVAGSRRVILRHSLEYCPQWSPDGQSLAVVTKGRGWSTPELRVVRLDGKSRLLTILPPYIGVFAWSPDGDDVAYLTEDAVWIAPADGGEPKLFWRSTSTPDRVLQGIPLPSAPTTLQWLRSDELAVVVLGDRASAGWPYVPEGPQVLHIIDVETRHHEKLQLRGDLPQAVISPDGSHVAVVTDDGLRLQVHDRASGATAVLRPRLPDGRTFLLNGLEWSPDGDRLLTDAQLESDSEASYARVSMAPDGTSVEVLTPWITGHFAW